VQSLEQQRECMKKSAKPAIFFVLFVFVSYTLLVLLYVGVRLEYEKLTKEKVQAQQRMSDVKNWKVNLLAQDQALSSEERIVGIAQNELGMVRDSDQVIILSVSKEKVEKITKAIEKKYE